MTTDDLAWMERADELRGLVEEARRVSARQLEAEMRLAQMLPKRGMADAVERLALGFASLVVGLAIALTIGAIFLPHSSGAGRTLKMITGVSVFDSAASRWSQLAIYAPLAAMAAIAVAVVVVLLVNSKPNS